MSSMDVAIDYILQAVVRIKKNCELTGVKQGIIYNISGLEFLIQKIKKSNEIKTIGFFGAQKRGKSTLINQLLCVDLLPVSTIPMSSVVIKVKHDFNHEKGKYTIDITDSNGSLDSTPYVTLEDTRILLKQYGSHKGTSSIDVDTIEVISNFENSKILEKGGVLIDTPGAEVVFSEDCSNNDINNLNDTQRALSILSSTHVVVFVERADYLQNENSRQLFIDNLKPLRPLCVINFKDKYTYNSSINDQYTIEMQKQDKMKIEMLKAYGVNLDRTICVSSLEFANAKNEQNNELLINSNLPLLEERILKELENLNPDKGLITCLNELKKILSQISPDKVKQIIASSRRPLYVFIQNVVKESPKAAQIARGIYEQFN